MGAVSGPESPPAALVRAQVGTCRHSLGRRAKTFGILLATLQTFGIMLATIIPFGVVAGTIMTFGFEVYR